MAQPALSWNPQAYGTWDSSDRLESYKPSPTASTITYIRDGVDRLVARTDSAGTRLFSFAGHGDSPAALLNESMQTLQDYLRLPGGVLVTVNVSPTTRTWSYPNQQGHTIVTTNDTGTTLTGPTTYDPWGTKHSGTTTDNTTTDNTTTTADFAAYGTNGAKLTEPGNNPITHMGARPLSTKHARFLTVDPIHGGCANNYVYGYGDPVNTNDLSGRSTEYSCYGFAHSQDGVRYRGGIVDGQFTVLMSPIYSAGAAAIYGYVAVIDYSPAPFGAQTYFDRLDDDRVRLIQPGVFAGPRGGPIKGMTLHIQVISLNDTIDPGIQYPGSVGVHFAEISCSF